ncbi:MAG: 2'-5' RNA ligase family protein [Novosphingobium sp.]
MAFEPFIVTAELPAEVFAWADALRREHFPPERNHLRAHVTLFHALAPSLRDDVFGYLPRIVGQYAPPEARITGVMDLGKGTALRIESPAMAAIREEIAEHFHGTLTAQDNHPLRLHITIQNKVERAAAVALQQELGGQNVVRDFRFTGIGLHLYCGGSWKALGRWAFRGKIPAT